MTKKQDDPFIAAFKFACAESEGRSTAHFPNRFHVRNGPVMVLGQPAVMSEDGERMLRLSKPGSIYKELPEVLRKLVQK